MDLRTILKSPIVYTNYQKLVGGYRARRKFVEDYLDANSNDRILDFGCGPGDILEFLPDLDYTGIDIDPIYIQKAKDKYGTRGNFICSGLKNLDLSSLEPFDYVIATGVLHHMDDQECMAFIKWAKGILKPEGKLLTLDGCYISDQNKISKFLIDNDRGNFVRSVDEYTKLMSSQFEMVNQTIEESYFHIPYTLLIMSGETS